MDSKYFVLMASIFVPLVHSDARTDIFCQMFANNEYRIDFAYQHSVDDKDYFFLVIDSNYWELEIRPNSVLRAVTFKSVNQSRVNADFKKEYSTGFQSARSQSSGQIQTGFLWINDSVLSPASDGQIEWLALKYETSGQLVTESKGLTTTIFTESRLPGALALKGRDTNTVCLLYQNQYFWANWTQTYNCYDFGGTTWTNKTADEVTALKQRLDQLRANSDSELTEDDVDFTNTETAMNEIRDRREVVAIFRHKYDNDFLYAFIYNQNKELIYCIKDHGLYNAPCKNDDNAFVDCSQFFIPSPPTPPEWTDSLSTGDESFTGDDRQVPQPEAPKNNTTGDGGSGGSGSDGQWNAFSIILLIVIIVVIVVIIGVVLLFAITSKSGSDKPVEQKAREPTTEPTADGMADTKTESKTETEAPNVNETKSNASDNEMENSDSIQSVRSDL